MHVVVCIGSPAMAPKLLEAAKKLKESAQSFTVSVIHVIDETLFTGAIGNETNMQEVLYAESQQIKKLCTDVLGSDVNYLELSGIPGVKIDAALASLPYDLLVVGRNNKSIFSSLSMGSVVKHLLNTTQKPIIIVP